MKKQLEIRNRPGIHNKKGNTVWSLAEGDISRITTMRAGLWTVSGWKYDLLRFQYDFHT